MSITVEELEKLVTESFEIDQKIDALKAQELKPLQDRQAELERTLNQALQDHDLKQFRGSRGLISLTARTSVRVPKTHEEKQAFFSHLLKSGGEDLYLTYASVNSQSLNSYYKQEFDRAKEEGNIDFNIPGVGEPQISYGLSARKAKQ